jgi:hypothetical protein
VTSTAYNSQESAIPPAPPPIPEQVEERNDNKLENNKNNQNLNDPLGRAIIEIPNLGSLLRSHLTGLITVKMCVNPAGDVIYSELLKDETTITDKRILKEALKVSRAYKFEKDLNAPEEQCGTFTFKLEVN